MTQNGECSEFLLTKVLTRLGYKLHGFLGRLPKSFWSKKTPFHGHQRVHRILVNLLELLVINPVKVTEAQDDCAVLEFNSH